MKNFVQPGLAVDITVPVGGVVSGVPFVSGSLVGIPGVTAPVGAQATIHLEGVYDLPKVAAQAWTLGAKVYWDAVASLATTVAAGNTLLGYAVDVAVNPSNTGRVRLGTPV